MGELMLESLIIFGLILLNGLFALSEIAIVSARKTRLQELANDGSRGARRALELAESPDRLLSTVQLGITLIGILAGVYGGATIAEKLARVLEQVPLLASVAHPVALGLVVVVITFVSIVVGELVPKRIGISSPSRVAVIIARPMHALSRLLAPFVWLLNCSSAALLRLLGLHGLKRSAISAEEIHIILEEGAEAGVVHEAEQDIASRALQLGDRRIDSLMTPRRDVVWVDTEWSLEKVIQCLVDTPHSYYPVCDGAVDNLKGILRSRDLWAEVSRYSMQPWQQLVTEPLVIPGTMNALKLLDQFKRSRQHVGFVIDVYGGFDGLVSLNDVLEAIVGDIPERESEEEPPIIERSDGSFLVSGSVPLIDFEDYFEFTLHENDEEPEYQTIAGFVVAMLGHLPQAGEFFMFRGYRFEVMDMDGHRVDKILMVEESPPAEEEDQDEVTTREGEE